MNLPPLILASKSPRRAYLLKEAGFSFQVKAMETDETYPADLAPVAVAGYIANKKAAAYHPYLAPEEVVITADTVVLLKNKILEKPADKEEAIAMLSALSGQEHQVVTGVCIASQSKKIAFDDTTSVTFKKLSAEEISYYVDHYKPFDKAGSYGAQEWMGMVAISKIEGSYFNVMGLPIHLVYEQLRAFSR